jgi:hypothetical protein
LPFEILLSGRVVPFGALLTQIPTLLPAGQLDQRLGCFQLLRLLQGFLGHFVSPSLDLPCWASAYVYAKRSPNFTKVSPFRNPLSFCGFACQPSHRRPATGLPGVELIIAC